MLLLFLLGLPVFRAHEYIIEPCPGITESEASDVQSNINNPQDFKAGDCACVPSTQYGISCPPGYFCPASGGQIECTGGFYCPANVSQPAFCCKGYYCPDAATMKKCDNENCPPMMREDVSNQSSAATAFSVLVVIIFLLLVVTCIQYRYKKFHQQRREKTVKEYSNEAEMMSRDEHDYMHSVKPDEKKGDKALGINRVELKVPVAAEQEFKGEDKEEVKVKEEVKEEGVAETGLSGKTAFQKSDAFDILYKDISLTLNNGRKIMQGASGRFRAGRTCAVMGPSGAGKTTLVTLVMGKSKRTGGKVFINGKEEEMYRYRDEIGFVPQEDIMQRNLTVWDILKFSADYRLPRDFDQHARQEECLKVMKFLEIEHLSNAVIGDAKKRGISGGQRKRVNIGMELVSRPRFLVLDEPTSGLDAVTSELLATILQKIVRETRISVAAIIHAPSPETFSKFDDFTLLGVGGTVLYSGERARALEYFESIGFEKPAKKAEADFFLEISMGRVPRKLKNGDVDSDYNKTQLPWFWVEHGKAFRPEELKELASVHKEVKNTKNDAKEEGEKSEQSTCMAKMSAAGKEMQNMAAVEWHSVSNYAIDCASEFWEFITCKKNGNRDKQGFFFIFFICGRRTYYQMYRDGVWLWQLFFHILIGAFTGVFGIMDNFIGPLKEDTCLDGPVPTLAACVQPLTNIILFLALFVNWLALFSGMIEGIHTFGDEQVVFWRHTSRGLPTIPYFLAKILSDAPRMVVNSAMYYVGFLLVYPSHGTTSGLYGLILVIYFAGYSFGYLMSMIFAPRLRSLWCVIFAIMWGIVFNGVATPLSQVRDQYGGLEGLWNISAPRWGVEAFYVDQITFYTDYVENIENSFRALQYNPDNFSRNCGIIFGIGWMWIAFTYFFLKACNRTQQK